MIYQKEIEQEKALKTTIFEVQEETLDRISKELHDDAGQQLTRIHFQLENLKLVNSSIEKRISPISESLGYLSESIRNLSYSINSQKFKNYCLVENIEKEIKNINKLGVISCKINPSTHLKNIFSPEENVVIFRIFQEALNNSLKHAQASLFKIGLSKNPKPSISFEDNGVGFSSNDILASDTQGLNNIRNRAKMINFECIISSKKELGTTIKLTKM